MHEVYCKEPVKWEINRFGDSFSLSIYYAYYNEKLKGKAIVHLCKTPINR